MLYFQVALGLISAKASHIVWPPDRWQRLQKTMPKGRLNVKQRDQPEHLRQMIDEIDKCHDEHEL